MPPRSDPRPAQVPVPASRPASLTPPGAGVIRLRHASPVTALALTATFVAVVDLAAKQLAAVTLGGESDVPLPFFHHAIRLAFVLNDQSAFGVSLGPYTWHINLALTAIALVLAFWLCRALSAIDPWAPIMLGLIAGAATGNLVSLIFSPQGVPDFIAVRTGHGQELVFNLADVAAVVGLAFLARTTWALVMRVRSEMQREAAGAAHASSKK
jgi:signal peptidase II